MSEYYMIITDAGAALETAAKASGTTVQLTQFAAGDGGGAPVTPDPAQTALVNEVYRGDISSLTVNPDDPTVLDAQCVIPPESGGYTVREIGLYTADGTLYAVGNYAEQQKPDPSEGLTIEMDIKVELAVSDISTVTLVYSGGSWLTPDQADALYLRQDKRLGEIAAQGADAQQVSRRNIAAAGSVNGIGPDDNTNITLTAADVGALPDDYVPPAAPVTSVNAKTGAVVLTAADVHALPDTTVIPDPPDLSAYMKTTDANAKFVQDVQLGAEISVPNDASIIHAGQGSFWSSLNRDHSGADDLNWYSKPIQININGVWHTISG
jgi:hypothetical protein